MALTIATICFPKLQARSLTGAPYWLPRAFAGERNVVLVGFELWHQALLDSWLPSLENLVARLPGLALYELVLVDRANLGARPMIDGGMIAGIPSAAVRARTLTAYTDLARVTAALGLPDTSDSAIFLIDRAGQIAWRERGGRTAEGLARLTGALAPAP